MKGPQLATHQTRAHISKTPAMCLTGLKSKLKFARKVGNKEIPIEPEKKLADEIKTDSTCKQEAPTQISETKTGANNKKLSESSVKINETKPKGEVKITGAKSKQNGEKMSDLGEDKGKDKGANQARKTPGTPKVNNGRTEARKIAKETAKPEESSKEKKKMQKIGLGYPWKQLSSSKIHKRASK